MDDLAGKVALITGAGQGIGREIAQGFASMGVAVAVNDINPLSLDETVNQVVQAGGNARPYVFDIAKRMPIEGMVAQVLEHYGRIDILINQASVRPDASLLDMDEWEFHRTLDVNLGGPFFTMQQVGRVMRQFGGGSIVNLVASASQDRFHKGHSAYLASQAGLLGLTQAAASEFAEYHVRVNAVCHGLALPGTSLSPFMGLVGIDAWLESHGQARLGDHPQLVGAVLYLCSPEAETHTGQIISIDIDK